MNALPERQSEWINSADSVEFMNKGLEKAVVFCNLLI